MEVSESEWRGRKRMEKFIISIVVVICWRQVGFKIRTAGKCIGQMLKGVINNKNGIGYDETTKDLIIKYEGSPFLEVRINSSPDSYTIGYGYDFSEKIDLGMFNRFLTRSSTGEIVKKDVRMTQVEAEKLIKVKELRDYIINNNGKYDPKKIKELFINSKGGNIKYDYKDRREGEAQLFTK